MGRAELQKIANHIHQLRLAAESAPLYKLQPVLIELGKAQEQFNQAVIEALSKPELYRSLEQGGRIMAKQFDEIAPFLSGFFYTNGFDIPKDHVVVIEKTDTGILVELEDRRSYPEEWEAAQTHFASNEELQEMLDQAVSK